MNEQVTKQAAFKTESNDLQISGNSSNGELDDGILENDENMNLTFKSAENTSSNSSFERTADGDVTIKESE